MSLESIQSWLVANLPHTEKCTRLLEYFWGDEAKQILFCWVVHVPCYLSKVFMLLFFCLMPFNCNVPPELWTLYQDSIQVVSANEAIRSNNCTNQSQIIHYTVFHSSAVHITCMDSFHKEMSSMEETVMAVMCFWILHQSVHIINMDFIQQVVLAQKCKQLAGNWLCIPHVGKRWYPHE